MTHPTTPLRIGTRSSPLAMAQARQVARALGQAELVPIVTRGDRTAGPLTQIGGKGLFTGELENALRQGRIDLAVHSAKDLPARLPPDMTIAAVPARQDARDALVSPAGGDWAYLAARATLGTSSRRRVGQALHHRPDLRLLPLRGNVQTRLRKLQQGEFDAIILALAGLKRLDLLESLGSGVTPLEISSFVPAAGQGALAIEALTMNQAACRAAAQLDHPDSSGALQAERQFVVQIGGDCQSPAGVHIMRQGGQWAGWAAAASPDGRRVLRSTARGERPGEVALALARDLLQQGVAGLLRG
jgi:hydroxymethylbilane synthase